MNPPGQAKQTTLNQNIDLNQNSDSTQNNQNSDLNQYSDYLDNLCLYSQLCTINSIEQYVEFFEQHLEKKS